MRVDILKEEKILERKKLESILIIKYKYTNI